MPCLCMLSPAVRPNTILRNQSLDHTTPVLAGHTSWLSIALFLSDQPDASLLKLYSLSTNRF